MTSTPVPWTIYTEVWAQLLPPLALLWRRNLSRPVLWVATVFLISWCGDLIARYVGQHTGNNHWLNILSGAILGTLILIAVAEWQLTYVERLTLRIAIIPFLLVYGALVYWVETITTFSQYAYPFYMLVILGAAAWTLLRRSLQPGEGPVLGSDWFWVLSGIALNAATTGISTPIAAVLIAQQRYDLIVQIWAFRAGCVDIAILMITWGVLRPATVARTV